MPRAGTPTDNAVIEAINGWIKEEVFLDFGLATAKDVPKMFDHYAHYYNYERPAAALGYKSPFSTRPNWASKAMVFFGVYFFLTDAQPAKCPKGASATTGTVAIISLRYFQRTLFPHRSVFSIPLILAAFCFTRAVCVQLFVLSELPFLLVFVVFSYACLKGRDKQ